jgi:predicted ATPase
LAQARTGNVDAALNTLDEGSKFLQDTGEGQCEADLHRLRGELLWMRGDEAEAEASLLRAVEVARRQRAKSWELRAVITLTRLWQQQGKVDLARRMLSEVYDWLTEGFDTADLVEARVLLSELS